jgi:hypothetical protein
MLSTRPRRPGARLAGLALAGALLSGGVVLIASSPALAGTFTKMSWTVSNSQTSMTGITYAFAFKTATSNALTSVTMTVPTGTAGTPTVGTVYGLGAGTASLAGTTLTYSITSAVTVTVGIPIYVSFGGLTNTATAGTYTSTITSLVGATAKDTGTTSSITFGSSSTVATVTVGQTLSFTNSMPAFTLAVDPSQLANVQSQPVVLTVLTNASKGYTLSVSDTGLSRTSPAYTIPAVSSGPATGVASFPSSGWGFSGVLTTGGTDGASLAAGLAGGNWVGFPSSGVNVLTTTSQTGATADTLTMTDQVAVDYTVPSGTYTDTITYTATPSY